MDCSIVRLVNRLPRAYSMPTSSYQSMWYAAAAPPGTRKHIKLEIKNNVAVIRLDQADSKVNTLSKELSDELVETMNEVIKDLNAKAAVIISAKPGRFIAGANINMLDTVRKRPEEIS